MPSSLMPADSNKELHLKLLDLLIDATAQYNEMNQLTIPEKIKKEAQTDYNFCVQKFIALPGHEVMSRLTEGKTPGEQDYNYVCRQQFLLFWDFYNALEVLIVRHYTACQNYEGNDYLKNALAKIPEKEKTEIKLSIEKIPPSPRNSSSANHSPRNLQLGNHSPRSEGGSNKEEIKSPRKRGHSHAIAPLSWLKSSEKVIEKQESAEFPNKGF